jgi:uncharacterized protein involved in exopolysaccharide biosynthesis
MTHSPNTEQNDSDEAGISLFTLASVLLRHVRLIAVLAVVGAAWGLAGLGGTRVYSSSVVFIPQGASQPSPLAAAASQFGFQLPSTGVSGSWGPSLYVELVRSWPVLETILHDTVSVAEEGNRRATVSDLLAVNGRTPTEREERSVSALRSKVTAVEVKSLGAVKVTVTTKWPSVSATVANRMIAAVNEFNRETGKAQAADERQQVELQANSAERELRDAENRLQVFLQQNRVISGSPQLEFEKDRLQRELTLRQQIYTSLVQSREDARLREARGLPFTIIVESARLPIDPVARRTVLKVITGGIAGLLVGIVVALVLFAITRAQAASAPDVQEFFGLVHGAIPPFLRRRRA